MGRNICIGDFFFSADDAAAYGLDSLRGLFFRPQKIYATRTVTIGGTIAGDPSANPTLNFATADGVVPAQTVGGQVSVTSGTQHLGYTAFLVNAPLTTLPLIFSSSCTPSTTAGSGSMLFITNKANAAPAAADVLFEWGYQASTAFVSRMNMTGDGALNLAWGRNLLATYATGMLIENSTYATFANQTQYSPVLAVSGGVWDTDIADGGNGADGHRMGWVLAPSPASNTTSSLRLVYSKRTGGPGAWTAWSAWAPTVTTFSINSSGAMTSGAITAPSIVTSAAAAITAQRSALGSGGTTAYYSGCYLQNATSSLGVNVQESPAYYLTAHGPNTTDVTDYSQQLAFKFTPTAQTTTATAPGGTLYFGYRVGVAGTSYSPGPGTPGADPVGNFATAMSLDVGGATVSLNIGPTAGATYFSSGGYGVLGNYLALYGNHAPGFGAAACAEIKGNVGKQLAIHVADLADTASTVGIYQGIDSATGVYANAATIRLTSFGVGKRDATAEWYERVAIMADGTYVSSYGRNLLTNWTTGLLLENTTPATLVGGATVQNSPVLAFGGTALETTGNTSVSHQFGFVQVPTSSAASSPGLLRLLYKTGAGAWSSTGLSFPSSGGINAAWISTSVSSSNLFTMDSGASGDGGATAYTPFLVGRNTSTPGSGLRQESPAIIWQGRVHDGTSTIWGQQFAVKLYPTSAATPTATLQFGFRQESGASPPTGNFSTAMSLTSGGALSLVGGLQTFSGAVNVDRGNTSFGTGVSGGEFRVTSNTLQTIICQTLYTQSANAKVIVSCYVPPGNVATLTYPDSMRLHSFGWTSETAGPVYTFIEAASIRPNGDLFFNGGTNAQSLAIKSLTEETTVAVGEATKDTTITIPAGAVVLAVTGRVTQAPGTTASFDIGVAGDAGTLARYANDVSSTLGTMWLGTLDATRYYASATAITITPNAAPVTTDAKLRITIHFYLPTAPTS